jgi:hypothetical protein
MVLQDWVSLPCDSSVPQVVYQTDLFKTNRDSPKGVLVENSSIPILCVCHCLSQVNYNLFLTFILSFITLCCSCFTEVFSYTSCLLHLEGPLPDQPTRLALQGILSKKSDAIFSLDNFFWHVKIFKSLSEQEVIYESATPSHKWFWVHWKSSPFYRVTVETDRLTSEQLPYLDYLGGKLKWYNQCQLDACGWLGFKYHFLWNSELDSICGAMDIRVTSV